MLTGTEAGIIPGDAIHLPGGGNNYTLSLYISIDHVPEHDWIQCPDDHCIFLTRRYLDAAEKSNLPGMQFRYAILRRDNRPVAVLYFQLVNLSDKGLGGILNLDDYGGLASTMSTRINDLLFSPGGDRQSYLLVCGNLLVSGEHGIAAVDDEAFMNAVASVTRIKKYISGTLESKSRLVAFMVKDFYNTQDHIASPLLKKDYFLLNTDPEMIMEINPSWKNFDDYLAALSSKYRIRANNARSKAERIEKRMLSEAEIKHSEESIFQLNDQVIRKAPVKLSRPSSKYFIKLKEAFGENYQIKGFFLDGKMIAFTSSLWNAKHFEAHFIGIDYKYNTEFSIYQNILYSYIEDAIYFRSSRLFYGRTALEIKSTVGAVPHDLACYFRFANRIINTLARPLVSSTGPGKWVPRDPFRK